MKGVLPLTAVLLAVAAQPAAAAFPGTNGLIAMEREGPNGSSIATVNADGTGARDGIVRVGPLERDASWAPDGRRLAFTSTRDGNSEIYVLDTDNGAQTRLTYDAASDRDPTWSPDGTRIAFDSTRGGNQDIYVMPGSGGPAIQLTTDPGIDRQPAWSATGTIAFASDRVGDFNLYSMDGNGGGLLQLTRDPSDDADASWSPDGSQLAFARRAGSVNYDLYAVTADGQHERPLVVTSALEHFPSWSPDGTRIVFANEFSSSLWVMPAEGGTPTPLGGGSGADPNWGPLPTPVGGPDAGKTITIAPAPGVKVLVAPATKQAPSTNPAVEAELRTANEVPVGTTIDASNGTVGIDAVTTTPDGPGTVGHADVTGGVFTVNQIGAGEPTLRMAPGTRICTRGIISRVPDPEGRMRIRARGRFRTVTGYGRAAARGTDWLMHARCDGTIFKVFEGVVLVHDYRRKITLQVRAGRCYLAARQRRIDALKPARTCPRLKPPR